MRTLASRRQFLFATGALAASFGSGPHSATAATPSQEAPEPAAPASSETPAPVADAGGKPLGWAIVGLGALAMGQILPAFKDCKAARPVALVSGHPEKAAKLAAQYGIEGNAIYNYENYDKIVADPRIDVVYIVLPNSMHAEYTVRALKAGKHVYCEKPMAVTPEEGEAMAAAARSAGKKLGIAYRLHYEPLTAQAREWCRSGKLGAIRTFVSSNCQNVEAPNIRLNASLGGGPLGDIGIYSINAARYLVGEEPVEVSAFFHQPKDDVRFKEVPQSAVFSLRYPSGALATCDCSFASAESRFFEAHGAEGIVRMENAFAYQGLRLGGKGKEGALEPDGGQIQINQFAAEMDAFCKAINQHEEPLTPASLGIADLKIIAALTVSAREGRPVKVDIS